jgi:hypothetical protein
VRRVATDRLDQVGDQVVPPAQLGVDVRPRVLDLLLLRDEPVVRDDPDDEQQDEDPADDGECWAHGASFLQRFAEA